VIPELQPIEFKRKLAERKQLHPLSENIDFFFSPRQRFIGIGQNVNVNMPRPFSAVIGGFKTINSPSNPAMLPNERPDILTESFLLIVTRFGNVRVTKTG
jgi:hypothetical protein